MVPALKGLGYGMLVIMFLVSIYYNMIIAWTIYYTFRLGIYAFQHK